MFMQSLALSLRKSLILLPKIDHDEHKGHESVKHEPEHKAGDATPPQGVCL